MQAAQQLRKAMQDIENAAVAGVRRSITKGVDVARQLSSGPLSVPDKRRRDHPYATRHGELGKTSAQPGGTAAIINIVTGRFKQGWQSEAGTPQPGTIASGRIVNRDEKADLLTSGTEKMIARPIDFEVEARLRGIAEREIADRVAKAVRKYE